MHVLKRRAGDVVVLTLRGEFDSFVTGAFLEQVEELQGQGIHRIVINMRRVKFLGSTAVAALLKAQRACRAEGGDLALSQISGIVRDVLGTLRLDHHFRIHGGDEPALDALARPPLEEGSEEPGPTTTEQEGLP